MTLPELSGYALVALFIALLVWWLRTMDDYTQY